MANYDFTHSLSPNDFELLSKDLIEADLSIKLENFREGPDQGIDLRYAPVQGSRGQRHSKSSAPSLQDPGLVVQCKRYGTFSSLKSHLKNEELPKITKLNPSRYIITTSVGLSPQQADEIKNVLSPYIQSTGDIYGRDRLNSLLAKYPEIERVNFKLWLSSAGVLNSILHAGTHTISREEVERAMSAAKLYVRNQSFDKAMKILKEHHVCIISGLPGIGKTTLARMLLLYFYREDYEIVKIESDISEARSVGYHHKPRFYYYDDFLGQTGQAEKLNKNEDQKLLDFMRSVREAKQSVFILTTREYILNQARLHYEKLDRAKFDYSTCVIDLSTYTRRIRAQILYNHLYFSDLPKSHLKAVLANRGYAKIVDHRNYNPRVIEFLTSKIWVGDIAADEYLGLFLNKLDNPVEIWDHAFRNQLSPKARHMLIVLTSLPRAIALSHLEAAFLSFHGRECRRTGLSISALDFRNALKELDGTFVGTQRVEETILVRLQNPSIRDFLQNVLLKGEWLSESIAAAVFFEQAEWFWMTLNEDKPRIPVDHLRERRDLITASLKGLFVAPSCSFVLEGSGAQQRIVPEASKDTARLEQIASAVKEQDGTGAEFIEFRIHALTERLELGQVPASDCVEGLKTLESHGHLTPPIGRRFVDVLKTSALKRMDDLDGFDTLGDLVSSVPRAFTTAELQRIREVFAEFALQFATDYEEGVFGIETPETIREDAVRLDDIGAQLKVDTEEAQQILNEYADKMEEKEEDQRTGWYKEEEGSNTRGPAEHCSDDELDSMFRTLGQ